MKKTALILTIVSCIAFCVFSCSNNHEKKKQSNSGQIVIIPDISIHNYDTLFWAGGAEMITQGPVFYFYPCNVDEHITSISKITRDTLSFQINSDWCVVRYRFNPLGTHTFLLNKDDTVMIKHENGIPVLSVINRKVKAFDINYDFYKRMRYELLDGYSLQDIGSQYLVYYCLVNKLSYEKTVKEIKDKLSFEIENEKRWLDSLKKENLISWPAFDYFKNRNKYFSLRINLQKSNITKEELKNILFEYNDSLYRNDIYAFYSSYYYDIAQVYYGDKVIRSSDNTNSAVDYRHAYDNLEKDSIVFGKLREVLKVNWLPKIIEQQPVQISKTYYEKILSEISDTVLIRFLKNTHGEMFTDSVMKSLELELIDKEGKKITFETIVNQNRGKVLYIDFWASWCAPCLAEMPVSKNLREEYRDKDIVFIYLSLDDKKDNWLSALKKAGLDNVSNSFLIMNRQTSPLIKELKINSIPRYLIYDKNGKLIHSDAPRPSSDLTKELLNV
jgi:thiol-disulfide isomerase/thioredoxin